MSLRFLSPCVILVLAACAAAPVKSISAAETRDTQPATAVHTPVRDLQAMQAAFVRDTSARFGIPAAEIEATLAKAQKRDSIIRAMSRPAEAKPWRDYRPLFVQPRLITQGQAFLQQHADALQRVQAQYGVSKEIITAILGVETGYGGNQGNYLVLDALYTLGFAYPRSGNPERAAHEERREAFFRDELAQLFALGKETGFDISTLKGSYAGAMGWGQFMPSSYRQYAVDGNADGKRDLFNQLDDVFASVANYFIQKGQWQPNAPVMERATRATEAADFINPGNAITLDQDWVSLGKQGYRPVAARDVQAGVGTPVSLITLEGVSGAEYWIVYHNFKAITQYNMSRHYATAIFQLAEAVAGRGVEAP